MLKEALAAELLPIRILHPMRHHVLVAQIVLIFQIMQGRHPSRGDARRALRGMIGRSQRLFKRRPIDTHPQTNRRVTRIDQLFQLHLEQLTLWLLRLAVRTHIFPQVLWRIEVQSGIILALCSDT